MRIGIQAWGSEGDVRPFLALGHALSRAGHRVALVLTDFEDRSYARYEEPLGVCIRTVATPVIEDPAELAEIRRSVIEAGHPVKQARVIVKRLLDPVVPEMYRASHELVADSDLVVGHFFHYPLRAAAELAGVPEVSVTLAPVLIPTATMPPEGVPDMGPRWNRFFWRVAEFTLDRLFLGPVNRFRAEAGLAPHRHMTDAWHSDLLDLVAVSPTLLPTPEDWPERHRVSGFLRLPEGGDPDPIPAALERFLADGDPPAFVSFGSLAPTDPAGRADGLAILERAIARAGCRAVIQGFSGDGATPDSGDAVLHVGRVPHARVFPRCAAVVHHAGAGTTQTTLMAGVPSVTVPHVSDQFFWAAELHRKGVGARPLPGAHLTASALAGRLREVVGNPAMQDAAGILAEALAAEDGATTAVSLIEEAVARGN